MEAVAADEVFLFEGFRLDLQSGGLFRVDENGHLVAVTIGSRALQILVLLVMRHGGLVSKDEIMTAVWPGIVVEDSNLPTQISALRRAIDWGRSHGSCIQTVSGRGYRFIAEVHRLSAQNPSDASACGDATGSPVAETSHSAPVVPERGLTGGLPATMVSDGEQGKNRIPELRCPVYNRCRRSAPAFALCPSRRGLVPRSCRDPRPSNRRGHRGSARPRPRRMVGLVDNDTRFGRQFGPGTAGRAAPVDGRAAVRQP